MLSSDLPAFRRACEAEPDDATPRLILADYLDERMDPRGPVLRLGHALRQQVGNLAFPDMTDAFWMESQGWEAVQRPMERLIEESPPPDALRQRYAHLVRGDVPLDPENLEPTLRLQYDLQVRLLRSLDLLDDHGGRPGITAIDGTQYPLPVFEDILAKLQSPQLQPKLTRGFDTLLLVPFGLPLDRLLGAWREGLRRNAATLRSVGQFDQEEPHWVWGQYRTEPLVYDPRSFTADHGGRTKEQLLAEGRGWDVLLVEGSLDDLPRAGQGRSVGGRPQLASGRSPAEYLRDLPDHEVGLTPEAYVVAFLDALERRGQVLDVQTASYLLGAYLPASRHVPCACWYPADGQADLDWDDPEFRVDGDGARVAVRVG